MRYDVTGSFVKISETTGTIQNTSHDYSVEVSRQAVADSGIVLYPLNDFSFSNEVLYMRCIDADGLAEVRVLPFAVNAVAGGGSASGATTISGGISCCGCSAIDIASDELIDAMLKNVFGTVGSFSGIGGCSVSLDIASDELINDMLTNVFGNNDVTTGGYSAGIATDKQIADMLDGIFGKP